MPWTSGLKEFDEESKREKSSGVLSYGAGEREFCTKLLSSVLIPTMRDTVSLIMAHHNELIMMGSMTQIWLQTNNNRKSSGALISGVPNMDLDKYDDSILPHLKQIISRHKVGIVAIQLSEPTGSPQWLMGISKLQAQVDFHLLLCVPRPLPWRLEAHADYIVAAKEDAPAFAKIKSRYMTTPHGSWQDLIDDNGLLATSTAGLSATDLNTELYDWANATLAQRVANEPRINRLLKEWRSRPENANRQQPLFM